MILAGLTFGQTLLVVAGLIIIVCLGVVIGSAIENKRREKK